MIIFFKGGDDHEIIEDSHFSISRVVEKNNSSYYMIDNRRVNFRDVSKKLEESGIDLRYNRFLILQGEVEQISLMKPKADNSNDTGMLEFLEDIIGTSRYKVPIDQLNAKYVELNEQRSQFVNRCKMSASEMAAISELKDEAINALKLENEKKIEKSKLLQYNLHRANFSVSSYEAEFIADKEKLDKIDREIKECEEKRCTLNNEEQSKSKEYKQLQKEQEVLKAKFDECSKNDYYLNAKRKTTKDNLKKLIKEIEENKSKLDELQKEAEKFNDNSVVEQFESEKEKLQQEKADIDLELKNQTEAAERDCSQMITERDQLTLELVKFKSDQSDKLNAMNEANNLVSFLQNKQQQAQEKVEQTKSKLNQIREETVEKEASLLRFKKEIPEEEKRLTNLNIKLEKLEQKQNELRELISEKNESFQNAKREANKTESRDRLIRAFRQEMAQGRLNGIFGRLGELGAIDSKYDVAISTAAFSTLKNFVVDKMDNAIEAIEFMKKNGHPSQSFIALDSIQPAQPARHGGYPEGVPRLFDLVKAKDPKFLPAFYLALQDTLVANDLEQASRIAYGQVRYRVVTLKGEVIERSGAMSGGGRPYSGAMGSSIADSEHIDPQVLTSLGNELEKLTIERDQINYQIESARQEIVNVERDLKIMVDRKGTFQLEVSDNAKRLEKFTTNLEQQTKELELILADPEFAKAETEYNKRKAVYSKEEAKTVELQLKLSELEQQIQDVLNAKLEPIKKRKKAIDKRTKEIQAQITKTLNERQSSQLMLQKAEKQLASNEKSKIEMEEDMVKIASEISELEVRAQEVNTMYEESKDKCSKFEESFSKIRAELKQVQETIRDFTSQRLDINHQFEKSKKVFEEKISKVNFIRTEIDAIVLDNIDDLDDDGHNEDEGQPNEQLNSSFKTEIDSQENEPEQMGLSNVEQCDENPESHKSNLSSNHGKNVAKIPVLTEAELEELDPETIQHKIKELDAQIKKAGPINYTAIEQYRTKRNEHKLKLNDLRMITDRRDVYMEHLNDVKHRRKREFTIGFLMISRKLKELYRTITLGGDADLEFIDSLDPFSEGVNFCVRPNKKSWKNNHNLSGGEKTLASLALIFALHHYKPSPLYIMDEIDAALDFKNVSIVGNYIKQRTRNTQFLIISLRINMYELSEVFTGVYKTNNVSKSIVFNPKAHETKFKKITTTIDIVNDDNQF